jgi:hypothetical protein
VKCTHSSLVQDNQILAKKQGTQNCHAVIRILHAALLNVSYIYIDIHTHTYFQIINIEENPTPNNVSQYTYPVATLLG